MALLTYRKQLEMLANEEKVDLLDAIRHAKLPLSTYYRSVAGTSQKLTQPTAEAIANAIKELSAQ